MKSATKRFDAQTGADREVQRILLELLNQMDGFDQTTNVKVTSIIIVFYLAIRLATAIVDMRYLC